MMGGSVVGICAVPLFKRKTNTDNETMCKSHFDISLQSMNDFEFEFELPTSLCRWRPSRSRHRDGQGMSGQYKSVRYAQGPCKMPCLRHSCDTRRLDESCPFLFLHSHPT